MKDRFLPKRERCRKSQAIIDHRDEINFGYSIARETKCAHYLMLLESVMRSPEYEGIYATWIEEALTELRAKRWHHKWKLKITKLVAVVEIRARKPEFIGPIQWKRRPPKESTLRWRANLAKLDEMQAKRPLRPPQAPK